MLLISDLVNQLDSYLDKEAVANIYNAYLFGAEAHTGQKRQTGEPYIYHPVAVASILAGMGCDAETIIAAILHDVIEDTSVAKEQVATEFGKQVAHMVDGVSKLADAQTKSRKQAQADNFHKMMLSMVSDIRIILIKLADRLHNMRTLYAVAVSKRKRIAGETLDFYIPLAERLGMYEIKRELETLVLQNLYPWRYRVLELAMRTVRGQASSRNQELKQAISSILQTANIKAKLHYREKSLFSVFYKMRSKSSKFADLDDINALRIIVPTKQECYLVLGLVHSLYKPVVDKFKDYIAIPKANGYKSLHTILFVGDSYKVEVQIRTDDMDLVAETGIASHWQYKNDFNNEYVSQKWLQEIAELQATTHNSEEFLESVKFDLFADKVFVFSPDGTIFELPRGATVLDFAYAIHTEIGTHCVAATIDNTPVYIGTELKNSETIAIATDDAASPTKDWLNIVITGKAISNIKHYIRALSKTDAINMGKQILTTSLQQHKLDLSNLNVDLLRQLAVPNLTALYEAIGLGEKDANVVMTALLNSTSNHTMAQKFTNIFGKATKKSQVINISGMEGITVNYAECCLPLPGDKIVGVFDIGHGLIVHEKKCTRLKPKQKLKSLNWNLDTNAQFATNIALQTIDKAGVLAEITLIISKQNSNIKDIKTKHLVGGTYIEILLMVTDRKHLATIIKVLRKLSVVKNIKRIKRNK